MGRKKSPPAWFPTLKQLPPYLSLRVPAENIEAWRSAVVELWDNPDKRCVIENDFVGLQRFQALQAETLSRHTWSAETSHQIIWWAYADRTFKLAVDNFLPPPYNGLPFVARSGLFLLQLLAQGRESHPHDEYTAIRLAHQAVHNWMVGPFVSAEITRRAVRHVGFPAGVLLLLHGMCQMGESEMGQNAEAQRDYLVPLFAPSEHAASTDAALTWALDQLRARSWRGTSARVGQALAPHGNEVEGDGVLNQNLSGQIWQTVIDKWGEQEPLAALAQALDGKFDIAPRAIADDIMDNLAQLFPSVAATDEVELPSEGGRGTSPHFHYGIR